MAPPRTYLAIRVGAALLLAVTAVRHFVLAIEGQGSVPRHWVFVVINVTLAALLVRLPRAALVPTIALSAQQLFSHGGDFVRSLHDAGPTDWISLGVCVFFPGLVASLVLERR